MFPEAAIAILAAAAITRLKRGDDRREVARWVKEQAAAAGVANVAGLAVEIATGAVFLRPVTAMATRFTIARAKTGNEVARRARILRARLTFLIERPALTA